MVDATSRTPDRLMSAAAVLVPVLLVIGLLRQIIDYDIWYHLAIGREIAAARAIPPGEFLMFPDLGQPTLFHEWGFELFLYLLQAAGGFVGLSLGNALTGALLLWLVYRVAADGRRVDPVGLLLLVPLFWLTDYRLNYRPEVMLYLAVAVTIHVLERYRQDGRPWRLALLPLATLLLSNAHPSALIPIAVAGCHLLQEGYDDWRRGAGWQRTASLCGVLVAMFAAAAANPYGFRQVLAPLAFSAQKELLGAVSEFFPTLTTGMKWPFIAICLVTLAALVCQKPRRLTDWLLFILFGWLAFRHVRNVALFALLAYPMVVRGIRPLLPQRPATPVGIGLGLGALCLGILLPAVTSGMWGAGVSPGRFPTAGAGRLAELRVPGTLFNQYEHGGYLEWQLGRGSRVFIDGRHYRMDRTLTAYDTVMAASPGWENILSFYGVNAILVSGTNRVSGGINPIVAELAGRPDWQLYSVEPYGLLFLRGAALSGRSLPPPLARDRVWQQIIAESEQFARSTPTEPAPYYAMGLANLRLGNRQEALRQFRSYLGLAPNDAQVMGLVAELLGAGTGRPGAQAGQQE